MGRILKQDDFESIKMGLMEGFSPENVAKKLQWGLRTVFRVQRSMTYQGYKLMLAGELYDRQQARREQQDVTGPAEHDFLGAYPLMLPVQSGPIKQAKRGRHVKAVLIIVWGIAMWVIGFIYGVAL